MVNMTKQFGMCSKWLFCVWYVRCQATWWPCWWRRIPWPRNRHSFILPRPSLPSTQYTDLALFIVILNLIISCWTRGSVSSGPQWHACSFGVSYTQLSYWELCYYPV